MDATIYPCDACGIAKKVQIVCEKCKASYCSPYCNNEDHYVHSKLCTIMGETEISNVLKLFEIDEKNFSFLTDSVGRQYVPLPGKIQGNTPHCMVEIYDRNGFGRKIWNSMDLPCGTLDIWYYMVKRQDLPKMLSRVNSDMVTNLFILLSQSPLNKKTLPRP